MQTQMTNFKMFGSFRIYSFSTTHVIKRSIWILAGKKRVRERDKRRKGGRETRDIFR